MFRGGFGGFGGFGGGQDDEMPAEKKQVDTNGYYELLGCDKKATTEQIRKAFRKKALKEHPDKGGDPEKFKLVTGAYEVLANPEKRQLYDQYGQQGVKNGGPPGGSGFGGLFDMFGGGSKKASGPRKGKPRLIEHEVTLEEVFVGTMKQIKITRTRNCEECDGKGGKNVTKCTKCKGQGMVTKLVQLGPGMYTQSQAKCLDCKGNGEIFKEEDKCGKCKGEKIFKVDKTLEVAVESGCPHEHDYIFTGESDQYPGIIAGDVYVRIKIKKHKTFVRKGADLVIIKKISLLEALSGVTLNIEHLDGKKHIIATAPGEILSNKQLKTVKGLGMPFYKDPMSHGHLLIEFNIDFPKKNFFTGGASEKLAKLLGGKPHTVDTKDKKLNKLLEDFHQAADLNPNPMGGEEKEEYQSQFNGGGGRQEVKCQNQ